MPSPPISILQPLSPRVFVLQSQDVREACQVNGCSGLEEIVRPWEGSVERVSVLSSTLTPTIHPSFPLRFLSFESVYQPQAGPSSPPASRAAGEDPDLVIDVISTLVAKNRPEQELHYPVTRSVLLSSRPELAAHETFNHPLCFMIAVSTGNPEPIPSFARLYHQSLSPGGGTGAWVDTTNCLRFYVLVHDVAKMGEAGQTVQNLLAQIKKTYGPHCTLLIINSRPGVNTSPTTSPTTEKEQLVAPTAVLQPHPATPSPRSLTPDEPPSAISEIYASALSSLTLSPLALASNPDPNSVTKVLKRTYGAAMDFSDTQRIAALIRELVVQSLVPWMEGRVREWNETYLANRRGITGRLFGAGRKFFGSRPASPAPGQGATGYNTVKGYYPATSTEALSRRLADFAFMLRDYKLAASIYDSLRRDFAQDRAWRYSASSTEMYGLSLLLSHPLFLPTSPPTNNPHPLTNLQQTDISSWLEQSVMTYTSRSPPLQLDAMRATILYHEAWRILCETRGVSQALMRAAGDMEEVPSAVLVEEAAQADVKVPTRGVHKPKRRRQAFHLVMAARRYEKSGHKAYSRRCLERAALLYRTAPWTAAQDHIEYALGRQAYTLGESDVAVEHFLRLLRKEEDAGGVVSSGAQRGVLDDLSLAYEQLASRPDDLAKAADKLVLPTPIFDVDRTTIRVQSSTSSQGVNNARWQELEQNFIAQGWKDGSKGKKPATLLSDSTKSVVCVNEPFHIDLTATNPLNAPLSLFNLTAVIDGGDATVETIAEIKLEPLESRQISLQVTASTAGKLRPTRLDFSFHNILPCSQTLDKRGKRLFATKQDRLQPSYAEDRTLDVVVEASKPRVSVEIQMDSEKLYEGESRNGTLRISNVGSSAVTGLRVLVSDPGRLHFESDKQTGSSSGMSIDNRIVRATPAPLSSEDLGPGQSEEISFECIGGPPGLSELLLLIVGHSAANIDDLVVAQAVLRVETLPLLSLHAFSAPSQKAMGSYILDLEMMNSTSETIALQSISAVSPFWTLRDGQLASSERLFPGQSYSSLLSVIGPEKLKDVKDLDLVEKTTAEQLSALLEGRPLAQLQPTTRLQLSEPGVDIRRYLAARSQHRLQSLAASMPAIPSDLIPRIFSLIPPLDLDLAVAWSIPNTHRSGISYLHAVRLTPRESIVESLRNRPDGAFKRTMYEETDRLQRELVSNVLDGDLGNDEDPVHVVLKVDNARDERGVLRHDFTSGPCSVRTTFSLRNQSATVACRYLLRLPQRPTPGQPHYVGRLSFRGQVPAFSTAGLTVTAWIYEPGLYNLGGWELSTEIGEGQEGAEWIPRASWVRSGEDSVLEVDTA